jgi:hypothetical protein
VATTEVWGLGRPTATGAACAAVGAHLRRLRLAGYDPGAADAGAVPDVEPSILVLSTTTAELAVGVGAGWFGGRDVTRRRRLGVAAATASWP